MRVTESQFADDVALYSSSRLVCEMASRKFVDMARKWGLTVNTQKTKGIVIGTAIDDRDMASVQVDGGGKLRWWIALHTWGLIYQEMSH